MWNTPSKLAIVVEPGSDCADLGSKFISKVSTLEEVVPNVESLGSSAMAGKSTTDIGRDPTGYASTKRSCTIP